MSEFIAHEVEIAVPGGGQGDQTDHFMKGQTPINAHMVVVDIHVIVNGGADQAEYQGLIADQCLVMSILRTRWSVRQSGRLLSSYHRPPMCQSSSRVSLVSLIQ